MTEIHVIFPQSGDPIVVPDQEAVRADEYITWRFHSANAAVTKVGLGFKSVDAKFFPTQEGPRSEYFKDLGGGHTARIWGLAPHFADSRRDDEYTVYGYDDRGGLVTSLDPTIITIRP